ncbi:MAG: hypothetical protein HYX72_14395 [Acidobacteria bacterium]|nr:hypothetical protein [Acidobacteriota bacterium]
MAADNKLELVIQVDADGANASIKSVNKSLSGLEKTALSSAKGASQGIDGLTLSMTKAVVAGNAIYDTAKKALTALKDFTLGAIRTQSEMGKTAERIGLSVEELSGLRHAAQLSGIDLHQLTNVVGQLSRNMLNSAQGATQQSKALRMLGIEVKNQDGTLRSAMAVLEDIADRFHEMPDGATKTAVAMSLLGSGMHGAGKEMITLLNKGSDGFRAMRQEAAALGEIVSGDTVRAAREFGGNLVRLRAAVEGLSFKIAEALLPSLIAVTDHMVRWVKEVDFSKLVRQIQDVAEWLKNLGIIVATYWSVTKIPALVRSIQSVTLALSGLNVALMANPWALAAAGVATFGVVLWNEKKKIDEMNDSLTEMNKQAAIFAALRQGKKLEELKAAGFSEEDIRSALTGKNRRIPGAGLEFVPEGLKRPELRIVSEEDEKRAEQIQKFINDATRSAREFRLSVEESLAVGPAKAVLEVRKEIEKLTTFVDDKGVETRLHLTAEARLNIEKALHAKILAMQKESVEDVRKRMKEDADLRIQIMSEEYRKRLQLETDLDLKARENYDKLIAFQEEQAGFARDAQLRQLEAADAQTLAQKVAVEARKAEIEVQYIERVHDIKTKLFDLESDRELAAARLSMELVGLRADEIDRRLTELQNQRDQLKATITEQDNAAIQAARENAANRQVQIARDHYRQIFDSLKQQAGGVFDALLTKSRSVFGAIGDALKTAVLTAIKDIVTSRVAAMLLQLFTGARVSFAGAGGGVQIAGGGGGLLGRLTGVFGVGAVPNFGASSISGGPGGTGGFAGPVGGVGTSAGSASGLGGVVGVLPSLKSFLGIGGSIQTGPGMATTWAAATNLQRLGAIARSNAALLGGAMLAMNGLQRGGFTGLMETTAGGALIGFRFGGPVGAAIGAGVGAVAGIVRLFVKSAQQKAREKIRATYGVEIPDKNILTQIVDTAKQVFGGNLDVAIQSPQIRDLIQLYAMTTGQKAAGMPAAMRPVSLLESGGSLFQQAGFPNGSLLPALGGLPTIGLDRIGAGSAANAGPTVINITVPGAKEFFEKETVRVVVENPRAVQTAAMSAVKSNSNRREMTSLQLSPGTLTS